jgi:mRNA interferase RelE/StbE
LNYRAIALLAENPRTQGVKKLIARDGYRVRVGDYRKIYQVDDEAKLVIIYRVMARGDVYKS